MKVTFDSATDLAGPLRSPAVAHGRREEQIGHPDPDRLDWYARYTVRERAAHRGRASAGASR
jgi:hypothetical protein